MLPKDQKVNPLYEQVAEEICRLYQARSRESVIDWIDPNNCVVLVHMQREWRVEFKVRVAFDLDGFSFVVEYLHSDDNQVNSGRLNFEDDAMMEKVRRTLHTLINEVKWAS